MYKECCPRCTTPFPALGPTLRISNGHKMRSKVWFECPRCGCPLDRRVPKGERRLALAGAAALFLASVLSILTHMQFWEAPFFARLLYALAAIVMVIGLRHELVRRRFHVAPETSADTGAPRT